MIKHPCPSGYYCRNGEKIPCAAGSYGSKKYLTEDQQSDICNKSKVRIVKEREF
jgi:hypothetical protein